MAFLPYFVSVSIIALNFVKLFCSVYMHANHLRSVYPKTDNTRFMSSKFTKPVSLQDGGKVYRAIHSILFQTPGIVPGSLQSLPHTFQEEWSCAGTSPHHEITHLSRSHRLMGTSWPPSRITSLVSKLPKQQMEIAPSSESPRRTRTEIITNQTRVLTTTA